ncbi:MAG: hypothetical protein D6702_00540 [Planctomycetota bacterium]|nr:MAG: hypothetical protein D6702_00540 [Planctomycetota bacterium]
MIALSFALAAGLCPAADPVPHIPHAVVRDVAFAPLPGGGSEMIACMSDETRVLRSLDEGLSWIPLAGAGLDRHEPTRVEYWPAAGGGRFLIGTEEGVWAYFPASGVVQDVSAGLPVQDRFVTELAAARNPNGSAVLVTARGGVYLWNEAAGRWDGLLATGLDDELARVAIAPDFDPAAPAGYDATILVAIRGLLLRSDDAGASWNLSPQFSTLASTETDTWILSLACADDFSTSGTAVLGTARLDAASASGISGEIWRSTDGGATFSVALAAEEGFANLTATPPGPSGSRHFFAVTVDYPDIDNPALVAGQSLFGVLRSDDGGLSWDDFGNFQDFSLREPDWSVSGSWYFLMGLAVPPDFAVSGKVFLGRSQVMMRSDDEGVHFRAVRSRQSEFLRGVGVGIEPGGDLMAFGASYGGGMLRANVSQMFAEHIHDNVLGYERDIDISPNFGSDGMVLIGGAYGNALWFDPAVPMNNLFNWVGWIQSTLGGTRKVKVSPHFHAGTGIPGTDRTFLWLSQSYGSLTPSIFRTLDGGLTVEKISTTTSGKPMKTVKDFAFAPTYDAGSSAGRTDVYCSVLDGTIFRLLDTVWQPIASFTDPAVSLAADPTFSRPGNPRLFAAFRDGPILAEIIDDPAGAQITVLNYPGLEGAPTSIALHPDFANRPVIYASVWGAGVKKLDLSASSPAWVPVGGPFPPFWTTEVRLSPDFLNDNTLIVSTHGGIVVGHDSPGAPWTLVPAPSLVDDIDLGWTYYQPNNPNVLDPNRPDKWSLVTAQQAKKLFGVDLSGKEARLTSYDGSRLEWESYGRVFRLLSWQSPMSGSVDLTAYDYWTGAFLGTASHDFLAGGRPAPAEAVLALPQEQAVRLVVDVHLDPGEVFVLDGMFIDH